MKRLVLILFVGCFAILTGCKKDDKSDEVSIVGTWTRQKEVITTYENGVNKGTETDMDDEVVKLIFNVNGSYTLISDGQQDTGTYQYANKEITLTDSSKEVIKLPVLTLTSNSLVVTIDDEYTSNGINYKDHREVYFTR